MYIFVWFTIFHPLKIVYYTFLMLCIIKIFLCTWKKSVCSYPKLKLINVHLLSILIEMKINSYLHSYIPFSRNGNFFYYLSEFWDKFCFVFLFVLSLLTKKNLFYCYCRSKYITGKKVLCSVLLNYESDVCFEPLKILSIFKFNVLEKIIFNFSKSESEIAFLLAC